MYRRRDCRRLISGFNINNTRLNYYRLSTFISLQRSMFSWSRRVTGFADPSPSSSKGKITTVTYSDVIVITIRVLSRKKNTRLIINRRRSQESAYDKFSCVSRESCRTSRRNRETSTEHLFVVKPIVVQSRRFLPLEQSLQFASTIYSRAFAHTKGTRRLQSPDCSSLTRILFGWIFYYI